MGRRQAFLALLPLVLAAPVAAQAPVDSRPLAAQRLGPPVEGPAYLAPGAGLFDGQRAGIGVTNRSFTEQDGGIAVRNGIIGSIDVSENATVGIGIFRVNRYKRREAEFHKVDPMGDVEGQRKKVAAVGFSLRF